MDTAYFVRLDNNEQFEIDLSTCVDSGDLAQAIEKVCGEAEVEIADSDFRMFKADRYSIDRLWLAYELQEELGEDEATACILYCEHIDIEPKTTAEAVRLFQDLFVGFYEDAKAFAESLAEGGVFGEIPERLAFYIDYDAIARDVMIDSYFEIDMPGNQIAVFHRE